MEEVGCLEAVVLGERKEEASWQIQPQSWDVPRSPTRVKVTLFGSQIHVSCMSVLQGRLSCV